MWLVTSLTLVLLGTAASQLTAEQTVLCGRELAKAHSLYCYGIDPFPAVAVTTSTSPLPIGAAKISPKMPERFLARARRTAEARLISSNLIEACCLKPCAITDLLNNC